MDGKVTKRNRPAERAIHALKVQEIINLSENKLIQVLKGNTSLPERTVVSVALELYKRRVPAKVETEAQGNRLTVIKIIKNHMPSKQDKELEVIDAVDAEVDRVIDKLPVDNGRD
jgi:hypothetical protein